MKKIEFEFIAIDEVSEIDDTDEEIEEDEFDFRMDVMKSKGISRSRIEDELQSSKTVCWDYFDHEKKKILDQEIIDRCNSLKLPPAWKDVWISQDPSSKVQAQGKDSKERIQYCYHHQWTAQKSQEKFDSIVKFGSLLPKIRRQLNKDLQLDNMPKEKVVALVIKLMDIYHIRVGNDKYAKQNKSYGLTTLQEGHITIDRSSEAEGSLDAIFEFTGKSGKHWYRRIWEDELALLIEASGDICGNDSTQSLFRYEDEKGDDYDIKSYHINDYIDRITPNTKGITAKDFRTWSATYKTAFRLSQQLDPNTQKERKKILSNVIKSVAADLGNTPAVCRSSYIHPRIINDWESGNFRAQWENANQSRKKSALSKEETTTLNYLKNRKEL